MSAPFVSLGICLGDLQIGLGQDLSVYDPVDQRDRMGNGFFIGVHHVGMQALANGVVGIGAAGTGYRIAQHVPGGHIRQLHLYQGGDLLVGHIGLKHALEAVQDIRVLGNDGAAGGQLLNDRGDNPHLVFAAAIIAAGNRGAVSREGEGLLTVQVVDALSDGIVSRQTEGAYGFHIHTADGIDQLLKTGEIDLGIVGNGFVIEGSQGGHGVLHTIDAVVGQFILNHFTGGVGQVVIPGGIDQQDLLGVGIHDGQNVDVGIALAELGISGITAAEIDDERLLHTGFLGLDRLGGGAFCGGGGCFGGYGGGRNSGFDGVLHKDPGHIPEIGVTVQTFQNVRIRAVEDHGIHFAGAQGIYHFRNGAVVRHIQRVAELAFQGADSDLGILPVNGIRNCEAVIVCVIDGLGGIVMADKDIHHIRYHGNLCHSADGLIDLGQYIIAGDAGGNGQRGQNIAEDLPAVAVALFMLSRLPLENQQSGQQGHEG